MVIAAATHPLAQRRDLQLADLAGERFILREQGSGTRLACDAHFAQAGLYPQVRLELGSNEAIKRSVAAGMGLAVMSETRWPPSRRKTAWRCWTWPAFR